MNPDIDFPPIQQRLMSFIRREFHPGYNHYNVSKLVGDASARQYYRYLAESGESFIVAAYPESFDPERFPYREVYELLRAIRLPVPEILALDGRLGMVLQEDLGNDSLQRVLMRASPGRRLELLGTAIDHIVRLQSAGPSLLQPGSQAARLAFDLEKLTWELHFFQHHYLEGYAGLSPAATLEEEFTRLAGELAAGPRFLCHRDYHIRNLMLKGEVLYIIDFQDARWGPQSYDLVSLLKDSIELGEEEIGELTAHYLAVAGEPASDFERQFHLMTVQRLLKALGTYAYQIRVRGNFIYEQYMAGSLHRTLLSLQAVPEFPYIQSLIAARLESL